MQTRSTSTNNCLSITGLHKSFNTPVLKGVDLSIQSGEIHALVGENGAGKSTLVSILAGLLPFSKGQLLLEGNSYKPQTPRYAFHNGISLVAQELSVIDTLSIEENICLRQLPEKNAIIKKQAIRKKALELMSLMELNHLAPQTLAENLTLSERQLVEIAKALAMPCKLLILDEPTAALTGPQADNLHKIINKLAKQGTSVIYISHRLEDVRAVCDTISVLRDGVVTISAASKSLSIKDMIVHMSGKEPTASKHGKNSNLNTDALLKVDNITSKDLPHPISFSCHKQEIVGIAGLAGSGRTELLHAIYGLTPLLTGSANVLNDTDGMTKITSPKQAVSLGVGYLPEERKTQGIFAGHSIAMNTTLPGLKRLANKLGVFSADDEEKISDELIKKIAIKCNSAQQHIEFLSGGNQQKVLVGRWLYCDSDVLLLDEPTRGVDVGAKQAIHDLLKQLRNSGKTILVASSEIEELTALCDRILVISNRKLVTTFTHKEWSYTSILEQAFSEYKSP